MIKPDACVVSGVTMITLGSEFETIPHTVVCQFDEVLELAKSIDPPRMVIDLKHTRFMDSEFVGLLFKIRSQLMNRPGGKLGISRASSHCRDVFSRTRLDTIFDLFETNEEAIREYASEPGVVELAPKG